MELDRRTSHILLDRLARHSDWDSLDGWEDALADTRQPRVFHMYFHEGFTPKPNHHQPNIQLAALEDASIPFRR